nr:MAG TPA: hypothetical protein [Caudoviricetes sp.]
MTQRLQAWYNSGPVAGDPARVSPIGTICKIFVQSSGFPYDRQFSRKWLSSPILFPTHQRLALLVSFYL